ncbi:DUF2442 domain-containing protein [Thiorhodovibrio frisius]|uniref:DUF2442 domain-containing protein n=1 Tax=Thiorhodovibrio frisius TaxID=631362 RepID=H8Z0S4_9GAMM|nr:DUF2442 domain-containing protein [Thiorhodovibrio frisius]EIC21306.1 Protein of unknown function (DUF2442) [Thiorhodovibrio frisius]WPL23889.1 hypothetical protein Thiofri_04098 [Thiorhodovibrio frisius]
MKLKSLQQEQGDRYRLTFDSGEVTSVDLRDLIAHHVSEEQLQTAHLDSEWGCLEFNEGHVDIPPKTLYHFACQQRDRQVA